MKINGLSEIVEMEKIKPVQQIMNSSMSFSDLLKKDIEENEKKEKEEKEKSRQLNWDYGVISSTVAASGYINLIKKDDQRKK